MPYSLPIHTPVPHIATSVSQTKKGMIAHTARKVQHLYDSNVYNWFIVNYFQLYVTLPRIKTGSLL